MDGALDRAAQGAGGPAGAQHVGVVNAVAARQRRRHQGQHLVARVRPPRRIAQVQVMVNQFTQTQVLGQRDRKEQPSIGHQAAVVEGDLDAVGMVKWVASVGCSLFRVGFVIPKPLSPKHRSTFLPLQHAATLILSVDWGLANVQNGNYYGAYVDAGLYWNATNRTRFMWMGASPAVTAYVQGLKTASGPARKRGCLN